jgi:hypothetical protein
MQMEDDWIWWEANRNIDDSAIARYLGASGDQFKKLLRCPSDTFEGRKPAIAIAAGQGPYLYSYAFNEAMGRNSRPPLYTRTKMSAWRSPSIKIVLTETLPNTCPPWNWAVLLTWRHGTTSSQRGLGVIGTNVSTVFLDGHAQGISTDLSYDVIQDQPDAQ